MSTTDFWTTAVHPDDREQLFRERERLLDDGFGRYRHRWIAKDGRVIWGETQIVVFKDAEGKPIGLRGATTDVTELRKAEIEIEEAKDYLGRIINAIADPIFVNDHQHRMVLVNDAFLQFTHRTREEVIGKSAADLCRPEEARTFQELDDAVFESGKDTTNEEAFTDREGNHKVMLTRKTIWIAQDNQKYLVGVIRDITERKFAEEQLKLFNEKLQQSNRELQDFGYVASHDLQEPLRKVQTFADRLGSKYSERLDETGLDYLERMRNAAGRMQTLIEDLLSFSRVTTKAQPFVPVDLEQVTREVLSDLEVKIEETGAVVETHDLPRLNADPLQMRQLIQNLVANALKFRQADVTPVIKVSATNGQSNVHGGIYTITVEDNGIGFDEKYLDKIFTVFQRLHGRTEYEGSGIGLAVCRKIVERHHGSITARSTPGQGSRFIFTLPSSQNYTEVN
jgi:PAS domain S-box-containing protein